MFCFGAWGKSRVRAELEIYFFNKKKDFVKNQLSKKVIVLCEGGNIFSAPTAC